MATADVIDMASFERRLRDAELTYLREYKRRVEAKGLANHAGLFPEAQLDRANPGRTA